MSKIIKFYLIFILVLTPALVVSQTEVDWAISQLRSGDPILTQSAKDYIIRRWTSVFVTNSYDSFSKDYKRELIQIINEDTTVQDTVMDHNRIAQEPISKGDQYVQKLALADSKTAAMSLVGILKIKEAIPSLVKHINYIMPGGSAFAESPITGPDIQSFPSALSLIMMNDTTAVPLLVNVVKKHPDQETRFLAAKVIFRLESDKKKSNSLYLTYSQSTDSTERKNLKQAIGGVTFMDPNSK